MGLARQRWSRLTVLAATMVMAILPPGAYAQGTGNIPGMGSMTTASTQPITYTSAIDQPSQAPAKPPADYSNSAVSFIDNAVPFTQVKLRFDANYDDRRPTRAEYLFSKSGVPGSPGWWLPEKRVDYQELSSYVEVAYQGVFSGFLDLPTRWVNPDVNPNDWGMADVSGGLKMALLTTPGMTTSVEIRGTLPTRTGPGLSTYVYSVEPGLLLYLQPMQMIALEGELRYHIPITGTDFAGDVARYGLGISFSTGDGQAPLFTPVLEVIGWTVLSGKEMVPMPDGGVIRSASGDTIVNAIAGIRFGLGMGDVYLGYGRSLTGDAWQHELWRIEFRLKF